MLPWAYRFLASDFPASTLLPNLDNPQTAFPVCEVGVVVIGKDAPTGVVGRDRRSYERRCGIGNIDELQSTGPAGNISEIILDKNMARTARQSSYFSFGSIRLSVEVTSLLNAPLMLSQLIRNFCSSSVDAVIIISGPHEL